VSWGFRVVAVAAVDVGFIFFLTLSELYHYLMWTLICLINSCLIEDYVFWVVTPCSVVRGYQCFKDSCYLQIQDGSMDLKNVDIPPQHYTVSQAGRPQFEPSPQKPQISHLVRLVFST
jgi:hypothetical protein